MSVEIAQHDCVLPTSGLRARIYYPAAAANGPLPQASWTPASSTVWPNESAYSLASFQGLPFPVLSSALFAPLLGGREQWPADAPPRRDALPLVLFSHGLCGSLSAYATVCAEIARNTRVVVAVEHADGTALGAYIGTGDSRRYIPYKRAPPGEDEEPMRKQQLRQRVNELSAALADIRALSAGTACASPLPGGGKSVDFTGVIAGHGPVVVAGHSFGAATALAFTFAAVRGDLKTRVSDTLCLDAWLYPLGREAAACGDVGDSRVLFVDQERSNMQISIEIRRHIGKPSGNGRFWSVSVVGGSHNNSSDFATRTPRFLAVRLGLTQADSDPDALMKTQNEAVSMFLDGEWDKVWVKVRDGEQDGVAVSVLPNVAEAVV